MTTAEIVAKAETMLRSQPGYSYSRERVEAKAAAGLVAGDAAQQGDRRLVYVGGAALRRERRVAGVWTEEATVDATEAQMAGVLVMVAAEAGRLSTHTSR